MLGWLDRLFNQHKFARRFSLFWSMCLITYIAMAYVGKMGELNSTDATVILGFIGILATVIGFYQWHRSKDDA